MTERNIFYPQWNDILERPNAWITNEKNNLIDAEKRKSRKYGDFGFFFKSISITIYYKI
jgi:hypothetical protein